MTLHEVLISCQQGKLEEAAENLSASARAAAVVPSMTTDYYHFANAAIKLGLEQYIDNEELIHVISIMKSEPIPLRGHRWLGVLYQETTNDEDENYDERYGALAWLDFDHFSTSHLKRLGNVLLQEGSRAYEKQQVDEALDYFRKAHRIASYLQDQEMVAVCLFEMGFVMHTKGETEFAEVHYTDAIKILSEMKFADSGAVARYVFHAARFFELQRNASKARAYFQKALQMFEQSGDTEGIQASREKLGLETT
jgi:tetratricopeptide (TPR) repeat protein